MSQFPGPEFLFLRSPPQHTLRLPHRNNPFSANATANSRISTGSQAPPHLFATATLSSIPDHLSPSSPVANDQTKTEPPHVQDPPSESQQPAGYLQCFMSLPQEIKQVILREVFLGSQVTYSIIMTQGKRAELYEYKMTDATSHRNVLMASTRCWNEGIELYYQETALVLKGAEWSKEKVIRYIPAACRNNVRTLFGVEPVPQCLITPSHYASLPKLHTYYQPRRQTSISVGVTDRIRAKFLEDPFAPLSFAFLPKMFHQLVAAAKPELKVYVEVELRVRFYSPASCTEKTVFLIIDCMEHKIISSQPELRKETTFADL